MSEPRLTETDRAVLAAIASGKSAKEIAYEAGVSLRAVGRRRARLMRKTGRHKAADLTRLAVRLGLVEAT